MNEIKSIIKRDGSTVDFDESKIVTAIGKALKSVGTESEKVAKRITRDVISELITKGYGQDTYPEVELVQDLIEHALVKRGMTAAAKAFILYREQHKKLRDSKTLMMDVQDLVGSYLGQEDWRVNENSNAGYSYASLLNHVSGSVIANYTLANIYPKEIAESHTNGDFHLHDLSCGIVGYCAGWSLRELLEKGFQGKGGRASAAPAKHFDTALGQVVNFLCTLQTEWAGAQAFSSFDTFLAPFIRHDGLTYKQVKQHIQQFIFGLNIASRWGQTPFTNLTFDWVVPEDLRDTPVIIGGELSDSETYGDFQPEMDLINKAFLEVMSEGDRDGRIFTFPIPTYNVTKDFNWDTENAKLLFTVTGKYGLPYFQNFINSDLKPGDVRSMCCRLQMDMRELRNKTGGLFGAGESTGSIGVVTINMPRLGYLSKDEDDFKNRLSRLMDLAKESLEIKRKVVEKHLKGDLLPYTQVYLPTLDHHFSTIGLVGMNEACLNFLGCSICDKDGQEFALSILQFMKKRIADYQEETGHIYNMEASPAEGCLDIDTPIQTVSGSKTIRQILSEQEETGVKTPVFSYNTETNEVEVKRAFAFLSKERAKVVRVTFDNGREVVCTLHHPFGKRCFDGHNVRVEWIEAKDLKVGDRIKSNNLSKKKYKDGTYYWQSHGFYPHRIAAECKIGRKLSQNEVVHHIDGDKTNNSFDNLMVLSSGEHKELHLEENRKLHPEKYIPGCGKNNPFYGKKHSEKTRKILSEKLKGMFAGEKNAAKRPEVRAKLSAIAKAKPCEKHSRYVKGLDNDLILKLYSEGKTVTEISNSLDERYTYSLVKGRLKKMGVFEPNHIVKKIEFLEEEIPVYNLEVEDNHNFFVGSMTDSVLTHNTSFRLAKIDKKKYPDIICSGDVTPYYTNSTQLPVGYTADLFEALDLQAPLQKEYTGGTVFHAFLGERIDDPDLVASLVKKVATNYRIPYFTLTPSFSICPVHGYIPGEHATCPLQK